MGLEVATFVADLVASNPLGSDSKAQGDDHIRLVKAALQATFPGANRAFNLTRAAEWSDQRSNETSSRALVEADHGKILFIDSRTAAVTLTLPDPSVVGAGWGIILKRKFEAVGNAVTIARFGAEKIDDDPKDVTIDIRNDTIVLRTNGTDWYVWARSSFNESNLVLAGSADTYTLATGRPLNAYHDGLRVEAEVNVTNTGPSTLDVEGFGADSIVWPDGSALAAGDLPLGAKVTLVHDGTKWQLVSVTSPSKQIQNQTYSYDNDTGVADAYAITLSPAITAYVVGQRFSFRADNTNTGSSTLDVNGVGAVLMKKITSGGYVNLDAGDIVSSQLVEVVGGATFFRLVSPLAPTISPAFESALLHVRDEKASGTDGGTFTSGSPQTRDINTEATNEISGGGLVLELAYDAQTGNYTIGLTVTDQSSGATGLIIADVDAGTTGTLKLINVTGTFGDGNVVTDTSTGSAAANIPSGIVAANQIYLPSGDYHCDILAQHVTTGLTKATLYDVTGVANLLIGMCGRSITNSGINSQVGGRFTLAADSLVEIRHECDTTNADDGFGQATSFGEVEVYLDAQFWRVAA